MPRYAKCTLEMALVMLAVLTLGGCIGGDAADSGLGPEAGDVTPPSVVTVAPAAGADDVAVGTTLQISFSEAIAAASVGAAAISLAPDADPEALIAGSAVLDDQQLEFTPSSALAPSTLYRAEIDANVADLSANPLGSAYVWTFTTAAPPVAPMQLPLAAGNAWLYEGESSATVWTASGVSTSSFAGWQVVFVEEADTYDSRSAWRVRKYTLDQTVTTDSALEADFFYLCGDADGLYRAQPGASWRNVILFAEPSFDNNSFILAGGPAHVEGASMSASTVQVPAGSFATLVIEHEYSSTGPYSGEDIFESRREHYADGVGLVAASWSYSFDDNDPSGIDITTQGTAVLLEPMNGAALPYLTPELEPNDGPGAADAQTFAPFAISSGSVHITDAGAILDDAMVDCQAAECILPDIDGVRRLEDWYRVDVAVGGQYRLDLVFDAYNSENATWNDLDLYVFQDLGGGALAYAIRADDGAGEQEWVVFTWMPAGSYYIAVQAWDTPAGAVPYTLAMREQAVEVAPAGPRSRPAWPMGTASSGK